jgi:hypothetical protein
LEQYFFGQLIKDWTIAVVIILATFGIGVPVNAVLTGFRAGRFPSVILSKLTFFYYWLHCLGRNIDRTLPHL